MGIKGVGYASSISNVAIMIMQLGMTSIEPSIKEAV